MWLLRNQSSTSMTRNFKAALLDSSENLKLSIQADEQALHNVESKYQESDRPPSPRRNTLRRKCGDSVSKRPLREKRQPIHLKDYEVQLNQCNITSCFFVGAPHKEPECYEKAKGNLEWEATMRDEI
ncbi:hypothetical protein V6N13_061174 [Hibiscus sabdariffa]